MPHYEQQYLDLMAQVWRDGHERIDRTGVGTRSILGATMRFNLADNAVPLLTTKRVYWKVAAREMIWFLSGETNIAPLVAQGVHIWSDWPLECYRRETGEEISIADFEARILADGGFAARWGILVRFMASSGLTGRDMNQRRRLGKDSTGARLVAITKLPLWWTVCVQIRARAACCSPVGMSMRWRAWLCLPAT